MSEKKAKIDLKARLGRASSRPGVGSSPPMPGAIPPPPGIAPPPPPGLASPGGIPAPPFGQAQSRPAPMMTGDGPFATRVAPVRQQPADIKVEIGHDVVQAQQKGRSRIMIAAAFSMLLGGGLGFILGGLNESSKSADTAVRGAQLILTDIEKASKDIELLAAKVDESGKQMFKERKFPANFSKDLADIVVAFDGTNLAGRNINRLKPTTVRSLLDFANDVQQLNDRKSRLARMFDANKEAIQALIDQSKAPKMSYAVFIGKARQGAVATIAKLKSPLEFDKDWPDKVGLLADAEVVEAERYKSGEPFAKMGKTPKDRTVYAVPIEPDSMTKAFPDKVKRDVETELGAIVTLIRGTTAGETAPSDEKSGLTKLAEDLMRELRTVGGKR